MRYCKYILLTISVVLGLFACQKDEDVTIAQLNIKNEVITPSYTSADIECWIECNVKFNQAKVECALTQDFQSPIVVAMEQSKGKYRAVCTNLMDDTTYYIRYSISNRISSMAYDKISTFRTLAPSKPSVQLDSVADIWDVTAKTFAHIITDGGAPIIEWGISLTKASGNDSLSVKADSLSQLQLVCTGLQPNTAYYVCVYAKNKVGTAYSDKLTFTTFALPEVETNDVSEIKLTTALLSGALVFNGNDTTAVKGFCWGLKTNPTIDGNQVVVDTVGNAYTYLLSNLKDETKYYVRAYARNKIGVTYGEEKTFTTQAAVVPVVSTTAASSITSVSAKVGGNVTADGGAEVTERGICYSTTKNPTTASTKLASGKGMGSYVCDLTGLQANTTYYVRAYAINKKGTAYGEEVTFTTNKNIVPPTVTTSAVTQITETTAVAGGNVTADGGASVTERGVVYSTSQNPTTANTKKVSGSGTGAFTCNLTGLQASTTYYVRAYAINEKGTSYGEQVTFKTLEEVSVTPEYVDLGLSVKWADRNVGASKPEEYGDYFAWGETEPKSTYDWSTYKYCNGSETTLTKYCTDGSYGTVDNKTQLELSDDAAHVNWGGDWRMPTQAEQDELREQCTWTWITQNGVNGYKVTSKTNGNSIFLPAAGTGIAADESAGSAGFYWSSSLNVEYPTDAWGLLCFLDDVYIEYENSRSFGLSVRPVWGEYVTEVTVPTIITTTVTQITETNAVAGGNVTSDGGASVTERGVVYSTSQNPTTANTKKVSGSGTGAFTCNLTGLQAGTTYYVRAYAINSKGTNYGAQVTFTTSNTVVLPTVTTTSASQTSSTTATVSGSVLDDGGATITERGVVYATYSNPTTASSKVINGSGTGAFSCNLTGLQSNTTYYVRAYAINSKGTAYGDQVGLTMTTSTGNVSYELNGGVTNDYGWQSKNDMFQACMADCGITGLPSLEEIKATNDPFTPIVSKLMNDHVTTIMGMEKWDWLEAYIMQVQNADATAIALVEGTTSPAWRYAVAAFFLESQRTGWPKTADYTQAGKVEAFMPYWKHGFANPTEPTAEWVLSAPYRQGYAFDGWYWNSSFSGSKVTTVSASSSGTLYAKWVVASTMPTVTTSAVTQITETTAVAGGNVTADGGASVTERGVVYSTTANPTTANTKKVSGSGTGAFTCNLTGLQAGTTYYVRAYAINSKGTNYGAQVTFTTSNTVVLPTVTTTSASQTSSTTATVSGSVLDDGGATITERGVVYATYSNPTTASSKVINGSGTGAFSCNLTGLQSNTTYYVRAYAINSKGTAYGDQVGLTMTTSTGNVSYELNGGVTNDYGWQSKNDMFQACMADCGITGLPSLEEIKATNDPFTPIVSKLMNDHVTTIMGMEKWDWLEKYIMDVQNSQVGEPAGVGTVLALTEGTADARWRYALAAFFVEGQRVGWPFSADFAIAGTVEAFQPAWKHGFANPTEPTGEWVLNAPYRQGYAFDGWYWNSSFSGSKVTTVSASSSGTLYAKWVVATSGTENGYAWVDLGLSVKWATFNVGATKPEEYGDYFAWGETEPKEVYDWSMYKWCNGSQNTLTKYNHSSSCGTVDNKTQLELSDDAARVNWGGDWRMPTHVEQDELRNNCTWTWTTQNGVNGYKVTSKSNGNSIFLPAAGSRSDSGLNGAGSYGNYWSSSLNTDGPRYAYSLDFNSSGVDWYGGYRYCGFSVRPVCQ